MSFSIFNRPAIVSKLQSNNFDLLIIGGGITGAGIALDAASRGLKVALVEKNDFAFGTSSRSTKLIHGGLRYLKQLEFGLVKEVGSERAVVHSLAPHLVVPEKMLLPLSEKQGMGYWLTSIGLKMYDFLAGVKAEDQRRMLTKLQTLKYEPLLRKDDIKGGAIYAEYRTDDARLTIEIIKTAVQHGATILSYARATDFIYKSEAVAGVKVEDQLSGNSFDIRSTSIVNAAGPWVDDLRVTNKSKEGKSLHLTKGVHIVVAHERFPVKQAIYFNVDDGRMIFAIPRGRSTYIGTTDTNYTGDKNEVYTSREDAVYLIAAVNTNFPSINLSLPDLESSWAGLRPLIHEEGKSASELSRKDEIFESPSGLISIAGGKLTGYRKMGERVVDLVIEKNFESMSLMPCMTHKIKLTHSDFVDFVAVKSYTVLVTRRLHKLGLPEGKSKYLVENYGRQSDQILDLVSEYSENPELTLLKAELDFCIQHEMISSLQDFFVRRTGRMNFDITSVKNFKIAIADEMKWKLRWSEAKLSSELDQLNTLINNITMFK
ncbi:MAG: glycerol-3-phosphate dehydrogenase/oxidase [Bacteroidia bacterium]|nr:glycerol-3-phosphate dehydrogenase/oxidase [Bacteroidia bacterium]